MTSPLETQIKNAIYAGFKGLLLTGTLRRASPNPTVDGKGDATYSYDTHSVEGIVDTFSEYQKAKAGIPESDVKILILAGSTSLTPQKDDQLKFRTTWYQARAVETDPAGATWTIQAFVIADPTV